MSDTRPPRPNDGQPPRRRRSQYPDDYEEQTTATTNPTAMILIIGGVFAAIALVICAGVIFYSMAGRFTEPGGGVNPELEKARMQEAERMGR